ncbi:MAG: pyruvate ferredoxin oxidoreductase subunit gamma [Candidatus Buchananbacteria bacterium]
MIEIRIHGRGGQGSVTMAELLAEAVFYDGKFSQAFPNFGVERRGAPVTAYVRVDEKYIRLRSQVYSPDVVIIQDSSLIGGVDVFAGLTDGGMAVINVSSETPEIKAPNNIKVHTIDAKKLALEIIGKPIINTIMLGVFAGITGIVKMESVEKVIRERFSGDIAEKNVLAAKRGFELINNE